MPRAAGIWRRESDGYWYTTHRYRKVRLAKSHADAVAAFHRLKSGVPDTGDGLTVRDVCNYRLVFLRSNRSTRTYAEALRILGHFVSAMRPAMLAGDLRPHDIAAWVESKPDWGPTYRHKVIATIQQAFSHAATDGLLTANPISKCRKPTPQTSVTLLTRDQVQQVIGACRDRPLRDITEFLVETGCRPDEARRIESRHLDRRERIVVLPAAESKGRARPRIIVPTPAAWSILERLDRGTGVVFRNHRLQAWTANALILRYQRIAKSLGFPVTAKAFRHTYITDALAKGVDCVTVCKLVGHTSPAMLAKTYGHLFERLDYLRAQAERAAG